MSQMRFQINGRLAGSAARRSEDERQQNEAPAANFKVSAGSAARDAEERKRAEGDSAFPRSTGFSLRAQNGVVQRHNAVTPLRQDSQCEDKEALRVTNEIRSSSTPLDPSGRFDSAAEPENSHVSPAGHMKHAVARAQSFLHRVFPAFGQDS